MKQFIHSSGDLLEATTGDAADRPCLPVLRPAGQQEMLELGLGHGIVRDDTADIISLFEHQAACRGEAIALVQDHHAMSYAALNAQANRLASQLREMGVGRNVRVGLCLPRGFTMVTAVLAVWKAQGAYVPLDPAYPLPRLEFMLADSKPLVLLTDAGMARMLSSVPVDTIVWELSTADPAGAALNAVNPVRRDSHRDDLAYIIYTSGSSGLPKGVMIAQRGLMHLATEQIASFGIGPQSRVLQFASFSFDACVSELITALCSGARLCLPSPQAVLAGGALVETIARHAVTHCTLPPAVLGSLPERCRLDSVKTMVVAGEAVSAAQVQRWSSGRRFINAYGPTEITVCATQYEHRGAILGAPPIGRPLGATRLYVLDPDRQLVPVGVSGELYINSPGIALGYWGLPEMNAERFLPDPFDQRPSARMYRTGDRVRWRADGQLEFMERIDRQIKLRGYRIEPGEIETALLSRTDVREAVVMVHDGGGEDRRLIAYVVPEEVRRIELWPSVAEYFVYDELLYHAMTNDHRRNESYKVAIRRAVKDKVVVEVGTGQEAILARFCVEAGALRVYAIELLESTYLKAKACIEHLGLTDRIIVIHGNATEVQLPELADVCVSEIVGPIGGSEGASILINDAWRFLKPHGVMIPERTATRIAALSLPDQMMASPQFSEAGAPYVDKVFAHRGYKFDLRLCLRGVTYEDLISDVGTLEDLDHQRGMTAPAYEREEHLTITRSGRIDGFLVWLNLYTAGDEMIDILRHEHCWLPVFFPAFYPGLEVLAGDRIEMRVRSTLCDNGLNPDYHLCGSVFRGERSTTTFEYHSYHYKPVFQASPFYRHLFGEDRQPAIANPSLSEVLKNQLAQKLPRHMVPDAIVELTSMPTNANGKVDRQALPVPQLGGRGLTGDGAPLNRVEQLLARIWSDVLNADNIGREDDFFILGGNSLSVVRMAADIRATCGVELPMSRLYRLSVLAQLAEEVANSPSFKPHWSSAGSPAL